MKSVIALVLTSVAMLIGGCGSSSSSNPSQPAVISSVTIVSPDDEMVISGQKIRLMLNIDVPSDQDEDFLVDYILVNEDEYASIDGKDIETLKHAYYIKTDIVNLYGFIEDSSGNGTENILYTDLAIPHDVNLSGIYRIIAYTKNINDAVTKTDEFIPKAYVNAPSLFIEATQSSNEVALLNFTASDYAVIDFKDDGEVVFYGADTNNFIENSTEENFTVNTNDTDIQYQQSPTEFSGKLEVHNAVPNTTITLNSDIEIGGRIYNVMLWDSQRHGFFSSVDHTMEAAGDYVHHFPIEINFPSQVIAAYNVYKQINADTDDTFRLSVHMMEKSGSEKDKTDNTIYKDIKIYAMNIELMSLDLEPGIAGTGIRDVVKSFYLPIGFGNEYFSSGAVVSGSSGFRTVNGRYQFFAEEGLTVPLSVLGVTTNLVSLIGGSNKTLNINSDNFTYTDSIGVTIYLFDQAVFGLHNGGASFSVAPGWPYSKTIASRRFMVGPVPFYAELGCNGGFNTLNGKESGLYVQSYARTDTYAGGWIKGGVDLVLAGAGVIAELTIIRDILQTNSVVIPQSLSVSQGNLDSVKFNFTAGALHNLTLMSGRAGLYAYINYLFGSDEWYWWFWQYAGVINNNILLPYFNEDYEL